MRVLVLVKHGQFYVSRVCFVCSVVALILRVFLDPGLPSKSPSPTVKAKQVEGNAALSWTMKRFLEPASRVNTHTHTHTVPLPHTHTHTHTNPFYFTLYAYSHTCVHTYKSKHTHTHTVRERCRFLCAHIFSLPLYSHTHIHTHRQTNTHTHTQVISLAINLYLGDSPVPHIHTQTLLPHNTPPFVFISEAPDQST